jgi:hypothetical protein
MYLSWVYIRNWWGHRIQKRKRKKEREEHAEDRGIGRDKSGHGKILTMQGVLNPWRPHQYKSGRRKKLTT